MIWLYTNLPVNHRGFQETPGKQEALNPFTDDFENIMVNGEIAHACVLVTLFNNYFNLRRLFASLPSCFQYRTQICGMWERVNHQLFPSYNNSAADDLEHILSNNRKSL